MKIAIDATVLWGQDRYSGVEKVVDRVIRRMVAKPRGHDLRVYVPSDWPGFDEDHGTDSPGGEASHAPVPYPGGVIHRLPFPGSQKLRRILWQQAIFPSRLRQWGADAVFCPAYIMPLRAPCPAVVLAHDLHGLHWTQTRPENFLHHRLFLPPTLRRAAGVLTPTWTVMRQVEIYLSPGCRRVVAPLGVDPRFCPLETAWHGDYPGPFSGEPYVLFVGNLEQRKGLSLLLEAFSRLREVQPGLLLALAGKDRGLRRALERQSVLQGIRNRIHFLGFVSPGLLLELYRQAAVLVVPSLSEGFGIPPLEAMACGTPVVAVRSPAVQENLQDAACWSNADPAELARAIRRILEDAPFRRELVVKGEARARQFTWERTTAAVWEALEDGKRI